MQRKTFAVGVGAVALAAVVAFGAGRRMAQIELDRFKAAVASEAAATMALGGFYNRQRTGPAGSQKPARFVGQCADHESLMILPVGITSSRVEEVAACVGRIDGRTEEAVPVGVVLNLRAARLAGLAGVTDIASQAAGKVEAELKAHPLPASRTSRSDPTGSSGTGIRLVAAP